MTRVLQEIPKIGLVMEAVKVVRWLKAIGDPIRLGDPLLEVETEKSVVEIEATVAGVLAQILLVVDQEATVGDPLAWIETEGSIAAPAPRDASVVAPAAAPAPPAAPLSSAATARPTERLPISPAARRLASEHGLALAAIKDYDPTPFCSWCGSMTRKGCDCGPLAENN
jgi:pyruvate/2-oxoglutarate dehydrogenase complex dihydrolipoamide acyltransferase (E2) component